jgi:hypothetical protein
MQKQSHSGTTCSCWPASSSCWPWIFWGVVWSQHGIQMNEHVAKVVMDNHQGATFFMTLLGSIASVIVSTLFSSAIIRFSQELLKRKGVTGFDVSMLLAFRYQRWPWGMKDLHRSFVRTRWLHMILIVGLHGCCWVRTIKRYESYNSGPIQPKDRSQGNRTRLVFS